MSFKMHHRLLPILVPSPPICLLAAPNNTPPQGRVDVTY
jgi:hypothetical protein